MLPPAQHVAMPGGTTGKQGNVLEVARERVGFVSLAIAVIWSSFVAAQPERTRLTQGSPCGNTPCRKDREARESRRPRNSSPRFGGTLTDGGAMAARNSIPYVFPTFHPDGATKKTNRSNRNYVIITFFQRFFIGSPSPPSSPPWGQWWTKPPSGTAAFLFPRPSPGSGFLQTSAC